MVRRRALVSGVCTGAVLSALAPRLQASIRMAGRIIALRGDGSADVKRSSGDQLPARAGLLLYGGDSIVVSGEIEVIASVYGVIRTYKATDTDTLVAERPISSIEPEDEQYFARFESFAAENPAAMPSYRVAREATKTDYSIKPSPLAPPGPHLLLESLKTAAFVWQGGSGRVRVTPDFGDPVEISSGTSAWLVLKIPPGADRLRVQLLDQPIQWTLNVAS